jgi:hypothetical protein
MFDNTALTQPVTSKNRSADGAAALDCARVVFVGDGEVFANVLRGWPKNAETEILRFGSALSAFQYFLAGNECDMLIVGLDPDDASGLELLMQLRNSIVRVPLVVFTDYDRVGTAENNVAPGVGKGVAPSHDIFFVEQSRGLGPIVEQLGLAPVSEPGAQLGAGSMEPEAPALEHAGRGSASRAHRRPPSH